MALKASSPTLTGESVLDVFRREKRPLDMREVTQAFALHSRQRRELKRIIGELIRDGSLIRLRNKRFGLPQEMNLQPGTLWCTRSGNGFLIPDKENQKDVFIPARFMKNALHGDRVIARIEHTQRGRQEGKVIKVAERKTKNITGFIRKAGNAWYLVPEDERIGHHFIITGTSRYKKLDDGALVACRITRFPDDGGDPECTLLKLFKGLEDTETICEYVQYKHNLPRRFGKATDLEAQEVPAATNPAGRLDLRKTRHVTIDGEFAKDFDDAVFVEKTRQGYVLYVSIADVSHYVPPESHLDREAYERGTSVYFPGTVIPMLPKALSNVICSLNPGEDRLTMTAKMRFNRNGDILESSFHRSVIRSAMRLTYSEVEDTLVALSGETRNRLKRVLPDLERMAELARLLATKRAERESLDFDLPEPEVVLDMKGGVRDILRAPRLFSHRIIEEFMIAANESVARYFSGARIPAIYRIHEPPDREKLRDFERLISTLPLMEGKEFKGAVSLPAVLKEVQGTDYEFLVNRILLRSMKQARYSSANKGHFGLASTSYLHFTSPIRRYPDLVCHRILKHTLGDGKSYGEKDLEKMAIHLSERERIAMDVEREIEDRIRVLFMKGKTGEVYEGIISHITSFGFFVELLDVFVEGVVLLTDLFDDYYHFQEEKFRLVGRRTKKVYRIGDRVKIRVVKADVEHNRLQFALEPTISPRKGRLR
jgi:ribonuclease R